jgi:hypothetical protein
MWISTELPLQFGEALTRLQTLEKIQLPIQGM